VILRALLDAIVLFSATYSDVGGSRELVRQAIRGTFQPITCPYVLEEARRNIETTAPDLMELHGFIASSLSDYIQVVEDPESALVKEVEDYVVPKDAPVVAAALSASADYLVTLDRKHLLKESVRQRSGLNILTPGDFLRELRSHLTS